MKSPAACRSVRPFALTLLGASLGLLNGCGSGITSAFNPNSPPPVASAAGPQLGYFWNPSDQSLRPILGIPGSSQVGQSVVPAGTYVAAAVSSAGSTALLQESDGSLDVMPVPSGALVHLSARTNSDAQIRFSPSGRSAIVFTPGSTAITLVSNLASTPTVRALSAPSAIQEAALADTGTIAFASSTSIQIINAGGQASTIATLGAFGGLTFATGDDLLYADAAANTLTLTRSVSTKPSPTLVPTSGLLNHPSAIGASSNGQWALLANAGDAGTVRIDLSAKTAPLRIACSCTPSLVAALAGAGTFRITAPDSGPLWAVDANPSAPRSFFIPAVR